MRIDTVRRVGRAVRGRRRAAQAIGVMVALAMTLAVAAPAWGTLAATVTVAPIGTGSYVVTVTNTGSETFATVEIPAGETPAPTNIVPSACANEAAKGVIHCTYLGTGAVGASSQVAQVCYTGSAPSISPSFAEFGAVTTDPIQVLLANPNAGGIIGIPALSTAVASCPVAGFSPRSAGSGAKKCVVPNVKGKKLATAEGVLLRAHCAVGKIKKSSSKHVKKGSVISQSQTVGKSLASGTKVSLVVSKG